MLVSQIKPYVEQFLRRRTRGWTTQEALEAIRDELQQACWPAELLNELIEQVETYDIDR